MRGEKPVRVYRVRELPQFLGMGSTKIKEAIRSGKLRSYKNGTIRIVTEPDLIEFQAAEMFGEHDT
jgi:hypothetical protein